jgi:hypothetical protein
MQKYILLLSLLLTSGLFAQTTKRVDKPLAKEKEKFALLFLTYLNEKQPDKAKDALNARLYKEDYATLCALIDRVGTEFSTYADQYQFHILTQWSNDSTMTFVCRFSTAAYETRYQLHVWLNTIPGDNCIIHLELLDEKYQEARAREHEEYLKRGDFAPPPPPPFQEE